MRWAFLASSILLAHVSAEQFAIPEVEKVVSSALRTYSEYVHYAGPTEAVAASESPAAVSHAAADTDPSYWLADVTHQQGLSPHAASGYVVFRNVKDYGAVGDGVTDDTAAINKAISDGNRNGPASGVTTSTTPAIVYFPAGTYLISTSIIDYYFTQLIGNPNSPAIIKATSGFTGLGLIDGVDQYQSSGNQGWTSTNVFLRQIRNLVLDLTAIPASSAATGIHWPTAQATSIQNVAIHMSSGSNAQGQGIFVENGSAGFLTDVTITGGLYGLNVGNQQYTMRNVTISGAITGISQIWNWGWTYIGLEISSCTTAISMTAGGTSAVAVGSVQVIDSSISNCNTFIDTVWSTSSSPAGAGNLIIENVQLTNVPTAVQGPSSVYLAGGTTTISGFGQGHQYTPTGPGTLQGTFAPAARPNGLLASGSSSYYTKSKPQYASLSTSNVVSMRSSGAKGDGTTDDTAAIQSALNSAASAGKVAFFDFGLYVVTDTIYIPPGSKVVGETYATIQASGSKFTNIDSPHPVVQVGKSGDTGTIEWSDMIVSTQGATAGAVLIEYNLDGDLGSGLWDVHTRIGGYTGSNLQVAQCPTSAAVSASCEAAYMSLHITSSAKNVYFENNWFWTADHDVDDPSNTQISIYTGRGALIEGSNIILYGTAVEHHSLYQYQFSGASNVVAGFIQTETPYYQPSPDAKSGPYAYNSSINDPNYSTCLSGNCDAVGLRVSNSNSIHIYGAGLYSFFNKYSTTCSNSGGSENCQSEIFRVDGSTTGLRVYTLNTVGVTNMITVNSSSEALYSDNISVYPDGLALFTYN
ncbi:putative exo-beta-1,3-glucanase [Talaromyces proteolyticus]|uniref:Exo-beta-1,3-glucanase n=1 Tax=Talaromyces proteolyticus TaxID=1131652 RepID=A0AAD4Q4K8_9EURO|nr:putative exo-beta-1,3-glucanase [Talaromyces proteolyticus]KAH8703204.1 putative exo-beta-1,3-glucanase [Talaromyces proteolyticus]